MPSLQQNKHYNFEDLKTGTLPHFSFSSSLLFSASPKFHDTDFMNHQQARQIYTHNVHSKGYGSFCITKQK